VTGAPARLPKIDATHELSLRSWVGSANNHPEFPIQNLPFGVFSRGDGVKRGGVAIGEQVLDITAVRAAGLVPDSCDRAATAACGESLNAFFALEVRERIAFRHFLSRLLSVDASADLPVRETLLHPIADCTLHLPMTIGDYTDFYAGIHHATNVGKLFRPDCPLLPNYKFVPIGYHGRASSVRPSGEPVQRPHGQTKAPSAEIPTFGLSSRLDYELELGVWIGRGNPLGAPIPISEAASHIAGFGLLNDWSARDIQPWEYQPLGPFLAKNFHSTMSPWIVTPEALAPFRVPQKARPAGDPEPLTYLYDPADQADGAYSIQFEIRLLTSAMRTRSDSPALVATCDSRHLYWTVAQLVTHHASGGCDLRPGDLFGTGTISGPDQGAVGSLLERTQGGKEPLSLPEGETRTFLEDGDEVLLTGRCAKEGFATIGFGECRAVIWGALP
jgi:fumarylacetoacetase